MSRTSTTLLALAAVATFGVAMLDSTPASARPGFHGPGGHVSAARISGPRLIARIPGRHIHPIFPRRPHWHVNYHYPRIWYAARPVVYGAVAPVVTNRCTCLTKEYTPEGVVVFKDLCTNEMAMNPPAIAPTAQVQPGPQQQ